MSTAPASEPRPADDGGERAQDAGEEDSAPGSPEIPLGIVIARIVIVTGMSFAGAMFIFFLVGAIWWVALASLAAALVFMFLMFAIERAAER
jgi:hypothetical protein